MRGPFLASTAAGAASGGEAVGSALELNGELDDWLEDAEHFVRIR